MSTAQDTDYFSLSLAIAGVQDLLSPVDDSGDLSYSWSGPGTFSNPTSPSTNWTAPNSVTIGQTATLTCTITDNGDPLLPFETGTKIDAPISSSVSVKYVASGGTSSINPTLAVQNCNQWNPNPAYVGDAIHGTVVGTLSPGDLDSDGSGPTFVEYSWNETGLWSSQTGAVCSFQPCALNGAIGWTDGSPSTQFNAVFETPGYYIMQVTGTAAVCDSSTGGVIAAATGIGYVGGDPSDFQQSGGAQAQQTGGAVGVDAETRPWFYSSGEEDPFWAAACSMAFSDLIPRGTNLRCADGQIIEFKTSGNDQDLKHHVGQYDYTGFFDQASSYTTSFVISGGMMFQANNQIGISLPTKSVTIPFKSCDLLATVDSNWNQQPISVETTLHDNGRPIIAPDEGDLKDHDVTAMWHFSPAVSPDSVTSGGGTPALGGMVYTCTVGNQAPPAYNGYTISESFSIYTAEFTSSAFSSTYLANNPNATPNSVAASLGTASLQTGSFAVNESNQFHDSITGFTSLSNWQSIFTPAALSAGVSYTETHQYLYGSKVLGTYTVTRTAKVQNGTETDTVNQ